MQRYKAKVAAGYYEQLRPRTMRERLDELTLAVHRLAQGQCTPISPAMRADLERERAFGGISAEEELQQHQENLERLDNDVSGPTESEMMERDHQDAATVMQQAGAGNRLPLEKTGAANQAVREHASQQHCHPMQPAPSMSHAHHALVCTPIAQSRPAMQPSSALQGFTPPDRLTQMRPCAALMPQHMQHEQLGSRLAVLPPMDLTRPPMPPQLAAPMPLAPANAKTAGLLAMYHMARAGLAQQGITIPAIAGSASSAQTSLHTSGFQEAQPHLLAPGGQGAAAAAERAAMAHDAMQAATGSRVRPVPDLSKFTSLQQMWDVWDQGTRTHMSYKQLEEQHGNKWRKDPPGNKSKNNSKRWSTFKRGFIDTVNKRKVDNRLATPGRVLRAMETQQERLKLNIPQYVRKLEQEQAEHSSKKPAKRRSRAEVAASRSCSHADS